MDKLKVDQLAVNVEMLLENKQRYKCMDDCKDPIKKITNVAQL